MTCFFASSRAFESLSATTIGTFTVSW